MTFNCWVPAPFKKIKLEYSKTNWHNLLSTAINNDYKICVIKWFIDQKQSTIVNITIKHESLSDLEKIIETGFKEGFIMVLENLNEILSGNNN